ncbi:MAG TPA: phosphatidate cytidylyltransferase [Acidobacteriaceae bacterium]
MQRILTAIVLIVVVVLVLFKAPVWLLAAVAALVATLALFEYVGLANARDVRVPAWFVIPAGVLLFLLPPSHYMTLVTLLALTLLAWASFTAPLERVLPDAAYGTFGLLWIAYPLALLPQMRKDLGPPMVLFLFVVVWSGDIAALYIGRRFGKRKFAPRLSPNKTWEGAVASVVGSVFFAMVLVLGGNWFTAYTSGNTILSFSQPVWWLAVLAIIVNIAAQVGDLIESAVKRGAGVKDSGNILPGHGGMLDRIDALLLAAPVLWYALEVKSYLGGF